MKNFTDEKWEAHSGIDYTVVMRPGECTENASITIRHDSAEIAPLISASPKLFTVLERICAEAESWHSVHGHGPNSVHCDSICQLIPEMQRAINHAKGIQS